MAESQAEKKGPRRTRTRLVVEVDLDPIPGWGNWPDDWRAMLQRHLDDVAPHYHPMVTVEPVTSPGSSTGGA